MPPGNLSPDPRNRARRTLRFVLIALAPFAAAAQEPPPPDAAEPPPDAPAGIPAPATYRLGPGDHVRISVYGEPDLGVQEELDAGGRVRLPLLGAIALDGLTPRAAESRLEELYVSERYLRDPQVSVTIARYRTREILLLGEFANPGRRSFPDGVESLDIVEAVTLGGLFTAIARRNEVRITRSRPDGTEEVFIIDAQQAIDGRRDDPAASSFRVLPGDVLFVRPRIF